MTDDPFSVPGLARVSPLRPGDGPRLQHLMVACDDYSQAVPPRHYR